MNNSQAVLDIRRLPGILTGKAALRFMLKIAVTP